jgi:hypothetical protein
VEWLSGGLVPRDGEVDRIPFMPVRRADLKQQIISYREHRAVLKRLEPGMKTSPNADLARRRPFESDKLLQSPEKLPAARGNKLLQRTNGVKHPDTLPIGMRTSGATAERSIKVPPKRELSTK